MAEVVIGEQLTALYPVIAALPDVLRQRLTTQLRHFEVPAGAQVFDDHQACQGFPFVLSGSLRVVKVAANGRELPLYRVAPGETCIISSSCLLGREPYNARGIAECTSRLALLPQPLFDELLADAGFRTFVFHLFAERIAELMRLIDEVAFRKLDARLAARLLGHGPVVQLTHQQLADELGSVREMVSRLLKNFSDQGLVRLGRERIEIIDAAGLRRVAGG